VSSYWLFAVTLPNHIPATANSLLPGGRMNLVSSSVSSLEHRYGFNKTKLGVMLAMSDVIACVVSMPISSYGNKASVSKARMLALFYLVAG
jgi:hypothetical protein